MKYGIVAAGGRILEFVAPTKVVSNSPVFSSDSVSLKRHTTGQKAQRWEITTNIMPEVATRDFMLHNLQYGYTAPFDIIMPQPGTVSEELENRAFTPVMVTNTVAAGAVAVPISTQVSQLAIGGFIKFGNHKKTYIVLSGDGNIINIYPSLTRAISYGTYVIYAPESVTMRCSYDTDITRGITYTDGILSDPGQIKLIERLE